MKLLERISLQIFSAIILLLGLILCLLLFGWIELGDIYYGLQWLISKPAATNTAIVVSIVLMLLSAKCIFFPSYKNEDEKHEGVLLENESGRLLISINTIENLVKSVVSGFPSVKAINCNVKLDKQVNNVVINLNLVVLPDTIIKDLSANLQSKIKEVVKTITEIEIKAVNIKIKNIEARKR